MPIPPPEGVQISLAQATPSVIDAKSLSSQLESIGLNCSELSPEFLQQQIGEVTSQLQAGTVQSFSILAPAGTIAPDSMPPTLAAAPAPPWREGSTAVGSLGASMPASEQVAVGNWTEHGNAQGYAANLETILYSTHFAWLLSEQATNAFPGVLDDVPAYTGDYPNAQAIQNLFVNVAYTASAVVVEGIDKDTMLAVFSNAIQPLTDGNLENYDVTGSRTILLAENYNETTRYADAIGGVTVDWRLQISDYKRKQKQGGDTHPTVLKISARAALYSDVALLCRHYNSVLKQFGIDPKKAPGCIS